MTYANNKLLPAQDNNKSGKEVKALKNFRRILIIAFSIIVAVIAAIVISAEEQRAELTYSGATLVMIDE